MTKFASIASAVLATFVLAACSGGGSGPAPVTAPTPTPVVAAPVTETGSAAIDSYLASTYTAGRPGAAVIVLRNGETLLRKGYGEADVSRAVSMAPGTVLRLGSITKQFTAAGIMLLAGQGKLALEDDIGVHLPQMAGKGKKITIEHLLTHTSGIANFTAQPDFGTNIRTDMTTAQMVERIARYPLEFDAGSRFAYSNSGYVLLGAIIEKVSGKSYPDFMAQQIFEPLGMRDTAYEGYERSSAARAVGHSPAGGGFVASPSISLSQPHAAGAIASTVDDLALWDKAISAGKLLPAASWQKMFAPYRLNDGTLSNYGYGFGIGTMQGSTVISHSGGITGFSTFALRMPGQQIYVAVLTNAEGGMVAPGEVANKVASLAMGK